MLFLHSASGVKPYANKDIGRGFKDSMLCPFDDVCYVVSNPRTYPLARPVGFAADSTHSEVYEDFAVIANTEGHVSSLT